MNDLIFVYGTLMRRARSAMGRMQRSRLHREASFVSEGAIDGALYDLGSYPGLLVPAAADGSSPLASHVPDGRVYGEVWRMSDPLGSFAWLDPYEGISPGRPAEYFRNVLPVLLLTNGTHVNCWVYVYNGDVRRARRIPGGRWIS